jgi:hypothetical protein
MKPAVNVNRHILNEEFSAGNNEMAYHGCFRMCNEEH